MSIRSLFLSLAALAVAVPAVVRAQEDDMDFAKARQQFVAGQPRAAANILLMSSLGVRQQVGRCRDDVVGAELLDAESQLEKLASDLRAGTVKSVKTLDQALTHVDHVLAQHHLKLVVTVIEHPRTDNIPTAAYDLYRMAFHFERSITLPGGKLSPEQVAAVTDARQLAGDIEKSNAIPSAASAIVKRIELQVMTPTTATSAR